MPRDLAELTRQLERATEDGFRDKLRARGQAQSMIRREGILPEGAPHFSTYLDQDLLDYGYSIMSTALRILEAHSIHLAPVDLGSEETGRATETYDPDTIKNQLATSRNAFLQASYALEAATRNADPESPELEFHRLIAGAASHMAGYAARAFSLVESSRQSGRLSPMELTLADLIMRDISGIEERTRLVRSAPEASDESLTAALVIEDEFDTELEQGGLGEGYLETRGSSNEAPSDPESLNNLGPITILLSEHYLSSVSTAIFAISFRQEELLNAALADLRLGEEASKDIAAPGPWWVFRLSRHIVSDLDATSILSNLPPDQPESVTAGSSVEASTKPNASDLEAFFFASNFGGQTSSMAPSSSASPGDEGLWEYLRNGYAAVLMSRDQAEID